MVAHELGQEEAVEIAGVVGAFHQQQLVRARQPRGALQVAAAGLRELRIGGPPQHPVERPGDGNDADARPFRLARSLGVVHRDEKLAAHPGKPAQIGQGI